MNLEQKIREISDRQIVRKADRIVSRRYYTPKTKRTHDTKSVGHRRC